MTSSKKIKIGKVTRIILTVFIPFCLSANPQSENLDDVEAEIEKLVQLEKSSNEEAERSTTASDEKPKPPEICVFPMCQDQ